MIWLPYFRNVTVMLTGTLTFVPTSTSTSTSYPNRFWMSDEYGPYIYKFSSSGSLIQAIEPPAAILPLDKKGNVNFTSVVDPKTGRSVNQGAFLFFLKLQFCTAWATPSFVPLSPYSISSLFSICFSIVSTHWIKEADFSMLSICLPVGFEGLTTDSSHNTLYALLQSATIQDGGGDDATSRYTRLVAFDMSSSSTASSFTTANVTSSRSETATGTVTGEWVVPLPTSKKGKTRAASELHYVSEGVFFVLSRDGKGHGDDDDDASYKCVRHFTTHPICGRLTLARTTYPF